jgi:hypothetical protein
MITVDLILLLLALACFVASAAGVTSRINLQSAGLACWILSLIV